MKTTQIPSRVPKLQEEHQISESDKSLFRGRLALIIGILLLFVCPFLFTRNFWLFSFSTTGQIGDTIGGITAPITGLLGAYLVYLALMAQVKANQIIQHQINEQKSDESVKQAIINLYEHYKILREEIVGFEHINGFSREKSEDEGSSSKRTEYPVYRGTMGIFEYLREFNEQVPFEGRHDDPSLTSLPQMAEIIQFLQFFVVFSNMIDNAKIPPNEKHLFTNLISHLFYSKVAPSIEYYQSNSECSKCGEKHGKLLPELYFQTLEARKKIYELNDKYVK